MGARQVMEGWIAKLGARGIAIIVLVVLLAGVLSFGQLRAKWYEWRADKAQETAQDAKQEARTQTQRADNAETSNDIQTKAVEAAGKVQVEVVIPAERSAQRIEAKSREVPNSRPDPVDADILRELEEADAAYQRAAGSLQ